MTWDDRCYWSRNVSAFLPRAKRELLHLQSGLYCEPQKNRSTWCAIVWILLFKWIQGVCDLYLWLGIEDGVHRCPSLRNCTFHIFILLLRRSHFCKLIKSINRWLNAKIKYSLSLKNLLLITRINMLNITYSHQILSTCYVKLEVNTLLLRVTVHSTVRSLQSHDEKTFIHKWIWLFPSFFVMSFLIFHLEFFVIHSLHEFRLDCYLELYRRSQLQYPRSHLLNCRSAEN